MKWFFFFLFQGENVQFSVGCNHFQFKISTSHKWIFLSSSLNNELIISATVLSIVIKMLYEYHYCQIIRLLLVLVDTEETEKTEQTEIIATFSYSFFKFFKSNCVTVCIVEHNGLFLLRKYEIFVNISHCFTSVAIFSKFLGPRSAIILRTLQWIIFEIHSFVLINIFIHKWTTRPASDGKWSKCLPFNIEWSCISYISFFIPFGV